ncbi:hypothetical protein ABE65_011600 [Fictibacillus phosphorivorans]|uniref:Uncharacterized protein n=1 Tax=Fictibacillus phosphorivorans TaxID=1221500 RepID=A0A160IP50_9BACL|nr:TIM-barrel domain-containing protein [Fictibacillus phosphorivorans]ANC77412.1 hypothetical protein ABE65_011600 [Fictibacillus phosphorivorans]
MILQDTDKPFIAFSSIIKAHASQLKNDFVHSEKLLNDYQPPESEESLFYLGSWVWSVVQHDKRIGRHDLTLIYQEKIEKIVETLRNTWQLPQYNLFKPTSEREVYFSNLGITYAALLAVKQQLGMNYLQADLTEIRDYFFNHGLTGGMLISSPNKQTVSTDLLATVMPFGLFSPEDLIMVEAVKEIESRLVSHQGVFTAPGDNVHSSASCAWLALYFTEKGDLNKARNYYDETIKRTKNKREDVLTESLLEIVTYYLDESLKLDSDYQIIHKPYGHGNHYEPQPVERFPNDPLQSQDVIVCAEIWPTDIDHLYVSVTSGNNIRTVPCIKENETTWKANIGSFTQDAYYSFKALKDKGEVAASKSYHLSPLQTNAIKSVQYIGNVEKTVWFKGEDLFANPLIYLGFQLEHNHSILSVQFNEPQALTYEETPVEDIGGKYVISQPNYVYELQKNPFSIKLRNSNGETILESHEKNLYPISWLTNKQVSKKLKFNFTLKEGEKLYGFGERYNSLDQRGNVLDCFVYNQYRDQGTRTYMPVPYFVSSTGYGMWIDTLRWSNFDLGSNLYDLLQIECDLGEDPFKMHLFTGGITEVIQQFTLETGRPILPPVWAFGPWMSSNNWDRDKVVREQVELTNELKIPSTVLVLEQWSDEATYYIFNDAEYTVKEENDYHRYEDFHFPEWGRWPDPKGLTDYLHDNGLKLILWQIPIMKYLNRQHHHQKDSDENYMIQKGFMVKKNNRTPYRMPEGWFKESMLMDFSSPEGKEWWFNKRQYLLDIGVDGFKTDGGEFVFGKDLLFSDGRTGDEMRNQYPNDYVEAYYDFANAKDPGSAMTFSRAGYTGAQKFPAHWAGDERSTFEAFQRSLIAGLSSGLSGIPFWGWDLGGFNGDIPTAELFIRSAQMAAFCPIMQYHAESKGEHNQDRTPWNIAERTGKDYAIEGYRFFANVRMNLLPYIYDQARHSSISGIPLMRALCLQYPDDSSVKTMFDQYMFGENLLVAPVIEEGSTERNVYFPLGTWYCLWTGEKTVGPQYKRVHAPLEKIPVYVKQGCVLLGNTDSTLKLGSYVGNQIDRYTNSVARIFLEDGMDVQIKDHLNQKLYLRANIVDAEWQITMESKISDLKLLFMKSQLSQEDVITINNKRCRVKELKKCDVGYLY